MSSTTPNSVQLSAFPHGGPYRYANEMISLSSSYSFYELLRLQ